MIMEITNETRVAYLFARFHHRLGFEKVLSISGGFPDMLALRDEKGVRIELEFSASGLRTHYTIRGSEVRHYEKEWMKLIHKGDKWYKVTDYSHEGKWGEDCSWGMWWGDENGNLELVEDKNGSHLKRKSLNYWIDAVVCWKATEVMKDRLEGEGIEVVVLKDRLAELGVSW